MTGSLLTGGTLDRFFRVYAPDECGPDGYPFAWHKIAITDVDGNPPIGVKDLVRDQAGHRCVRCFHPYLKGQHGRGEWSPCDGRCTHDGPCRTGPAGFGTETLVTEAQWRILTVHHLTGDKADLRWWNLASLCQRCHLTIQGRVNMHRVYPWPHSEWFKPYAAGWYAWTYLNEEPTRAEVEARLDELLALECAA